MLETASIVAGMVLAASASTGASEDKPDLAAIHRIKAEAFENSQVMEHLFWLTDANGPRLTGSPGFRRSADWAVHRLEGWGAASPHLEKWGTFGRAWTATHLSVRLVEPVRAELMAAPKAWCAGTQGPISAEVIEAPLFQRWESDVAAGYDFAALAARIAQYIQTYRGKLHGRIVLRDPLRELEPPTEVPATRFDDPKLASSSLASDHAPTEPYEWPLQSLPRDPKKRADFLAHLPLEVKVDWWERVTQAYRPLWDFYASEGVAAVFSTDERGAGGIIFAESTGQWDPKRPLPPPALVLAPEHYNRLVRLADRKIPTRVEVDLGVEAPPDAVDGLNVVAEIPGGKNRDEVVVFGAHLDSWHTGTGATDNGAGSAVMLEAFRILKAVRLPMHRTVRIALWSGEEQALYGSRGYVKHHFADPVTMKLEPEHAKVAAYFNVDNGGGKIRGVWLQGNDMVRPIFDAWLLPFKDEGATALSIRDTGGTDHQSFDAVGLPGFQFIQDPLDYRTRTHHSALDVYDHVNPGDLMQASAIVATFIYQAANRPQMLPRKPLPQPLPPRK
jgi:carboxypeptidase Q